MNLSLFVQIKFAWKVYKIKWCCLPVLPVESELKPLPYWLVPKPRCLLQEDMSRPCMPLPNRLVFRLVSVC